ncbi:MAG: endonuclease [Crocosphaera sp.]|nr:endonuclease [Crocosphaera sp.]
MSNHLFPTLKPINEKRGSNPFAEIPDNQTDAWFFERQELSFPPSRDIIDNFSESNSSAFEPREAIKGDIARAQFYIASIYRNQVNSNFFKGQQKTLCQWHKSDPVDTAEMTRNSKIKALQGNDNPFILDATLADRLYCQ